MANDNVAALIEKVHTATINFREADEAYHRTSNTRIQRLNELNIAQRELDASLDALKKAAPIDTGWHKAGRTLIPTLEGSSANGG